ncbi:glycosyltransferase family 2 protein [Clostridium septicum]|uniref:Glycosyltransferase family 2 protein n=1 Tax=Clostridium septicum TaxID=1504 RepID=A0A9N7JMV2_CLOSE|nr:glycosyltransferase family 2 protein [Clostridium septicum]AYE34869.1 glycosyltransferase family 2 protein [Clostridium septicum]MDU1314697.1 glycosyltransferase family 2 protein [Clostridium septicum]QAS60264.1 glycosyltransferase family 2 protein [Clostridium septicum]UEC20481.1 glycosyltransferase family 2 protein [Clostridium septicum]USS01463.1 glycosyltransferase family 2 protein [Clostridium septicum]
MEKELLVIVPAYNEEDNIKNVIEELKKDVPYANILVVNDSSTDKTEEILKNMNVDYITTPFNLRYSGVIQTGFKYALFRNYNYVAQFDGDGQHIAKELDKMFKYIKQNDCDIVLGSRFKEKTEYNHAFFRKIGTIMFQKIIKISTRKEITDPTSGLQVLSKRVYTHYAKMNNYPEYPDANLIIEMLNEGYNIQEVYVKMRERIYGISMHSGIWSPIKYMISMCYSIFIILIGKKSNNTYKNYNEACGEVK